MGTRMSSRSMTRELRERLILAEKENRPLRVYCGYDPRKADLHLGHTITMRKLRQFQDLGHEVTFLIGTYTSLIGDPSDKRYSTSTLDCGRGGRKCSHLCAPGFPCSGSGKNHHSIQRRMAAKLTFADLIHLSSNFTIQQFLTRENFKLRFERRRCDLPS